MKDIQGKALKGLFWILVGVLIFMLISRLTGHSATDVQIFLTIFGLVFTSITDMHRRIGSIESRVESGFKKVSEDMSLIKTKLNKI